MGDLDLDLNARKCILGFSFFPFYWEIRKRISKSLLKTCSFAHPHVISRKKGPNKLGFKNYETVKKKNPSNLDYDFFIEIHLKSVFRFCVLLHSPQSVLQKKSRFPNRHYTLLLSRKSQWKILKYWRMFSHHCLLGVFLGVAETIVG